MFGSAGRYMFTGNTESAVSRRRIVRRGAAAVDVATVVSVMRLLEF